jgi:sulfur carrier protein
VTQPSPPPTDVVQITVNAAPRQVPARTTIAQLIALVAPGAACAVEVNRTLIPHRQHASRTLEQGDSVEVVSLVGGG